jgi:hypothetical protein
MTIPVDSADLREQCVAAPAHVGRGDDVFVSLPFGMLQRKTWPLPFLGWFATCTDPHGNEVGLWQTDPSAPAPTG